MMNNNRVFQIMTLIWWSSFEEYFTFILFFQNKSCVTRFRKRLGNPVTLGCEPRKTYGKSQPQNLPQKGHVSRLGYGRQWEAVEARVFFSALGEMTNGEFSEQMERWKSYGNHMYIYIYIYIYYIYISGTCLFSILVVEPFKTRSFPIKTRVIWVPGHLGSNQNKDPCGD